MRSQRYSLKRTSMYAPIEPSAAPPTRNSKRAPATNSIVNVKNSSTTAPPKSGCFKHRSTRPPEMITCGNMPTEKLLTRSPFFSRE